MQMDHTCSPRCEMRRRSGPGFRDSRHASSSGRRTTTEPLDHPGDATVPSRKPVTLAVVGVVGVFAMRSGSRSMRRRRAVLEAISRMLPVGPRQLGDRSPCAWTTPADPASAISDRVSAGVLAEKQSSTASARWVLVGAVLDVATTSSSERSRPRPRFRGDGVPVGPWAGPHRLHGRAGHVQRGRAPTLPATLMSGCPVHTAGVPPDTDGVGPGTPTRSRSRRMWTTRGGRCGDHVPIADALRLPCGARRRCRAPAGHRPALCPLPHEFRSSESGRRWFLGADRSFVGMCQPDYHPASASPLLMTCAPTRSARRVSSAAARSGSACQLAARVNVRCVTPLGAEVASTR